VLRDKVSYQYKTTGKMILFAYFSLYKGKDAEMNASKLS
jgi:hypothetical protein